MMDGNISELQKAIDEQINNNLRACAQEIDEVLKKYNAIIEPEIVLSGSGVVRSGIKLAIKDDLK